MTTKLEINKNLQVFFNPTNDPIEILEDILEDSSYEYTYVTVEIEEDLQYYRDTGVLEDLEWYGSYDIAIYVYHSYFIEYTILEREIYAMTDEDRLKYLTVRSCQGEKDYKTEGELKAMRIKWEAKKKKFMTKELSKRKKKFKKLDAPETLADFEEEIVG